MNKIEIPGGWYGEAHPNGAYAVALFEQQALETHKGRWNIGRDLLYVRTRAIPTFHAAGQDQNGAGNYEVNSDGDIMRVGDSFGVNPVIYDLQGNLIQATASHQGFRYVGPDNRPRTGDETYRAGSLYEYTDAGDVRIGQGQESGCIVEIDGKRRVLETGHCTFIRVQFDSAMFAITIVKLQENKTVIYWLTRPELAALPELVSPADPPKDEPKDPKPEEPMPFIPEQEVKRAKEMLSTVRVQTGFGPGKPPFPYVKEVAARLGGKWGLNGKRGNKNDPSTDILAYKLSDDPSIQPIIVDVVVDGGGANGEAFGVLEYPQEFGAVWIAPGSPQDATGDVPEPTPDPTPSFDPKPLLERLNALEAASRWTVTVMDLLAQRIAELENRKFTVEIGSSWGHRHNATVKETK